MNFGNLLHWAVIFLIVAVVAALLGFTNALGAETPGYQVEVCAALSQSREQALERGAAVAGAAFPRLVDIGRDLDPTTAGEIRVAVWAR